MLERVLEALGDGATFVSGQTIGRALGKSRTAVWQKIEELKEAGYEIEASTKKGYRLVRRPDRLYAWEVQPKLSTEVIGRRYAYLERVASTNDAAKEQARSGAAEGLVVVAEEQSRGRGRRGRGWFSPFGLGIWMSILLRPTLHPSEAPQAALVAALATAHGIEASTGLSTAVKWPNDVLIEGKKVSGILVEMEAELEALQYLVVGIGVNANLPRESLPPEARKSATSLGEAKGERIDRAQVTAAILTALEREYFRWIEEGFAGVIERLRPKMISIGRRLRVLEAKRVWEGEGVDLAADGALLVRRAEDGHVVPVYAAEVTLRDG